MTTGGKDETGGFDSQEDEALWRLLGRQAPPVRVNPYFARRVLRELALAEDRHGGGWFLRLRRLWTLTPRHAAAWSGAFALGVLCLSAVLTLPADRPPAMHTAAVESSAAVSLVPPAAPEAALSAEVAPTQDVEMIADLDNLLDREESRLWTEDSDTARF